MKQQPGTGSIASNFSALLPHENRSTRRQWLAGYALMFAATASSAGDKPAAAESPYLDEMPIVLSVSRLSQPVDEAPAAVTVIDRQMIKESGAWDLTEVFRLVPGMYVAKHASNVYTTNSMVSYHGLSDAYAHRMQVLIDGRSVYSPLFGGVLWSDLPLAIDDIERIEVIRGPNSASYGANSFLGVINILTRHSAEEQGNTLSLSAGRGRSEAMARHGGQMNNGLTYRLTARSRNDVGEDQKILHPVDNSATWASNKYDDKKIRMISFRADYQIDPRDALEFQFGYNGGDRQEGFSEDTFSPRWKSVDNHFELLKWRRSFEPGNEISVQFYHSYESASDTIYTTDSNPAPYLGLSFNASVVAQRYDLEAQHIFSPSDNTRVVWGGSVRLDSTYWPLYLNRQDAYDFHLARMFGNLEWRARPDLLFNVGAMAENNDFTGTDITPRAAVNWHFLPGHTLRASHSKATRTPTLFEEKADNRYRIPSFPADLISRYSLGGLKPERITSNEVGYLHKSGLVDLDFRVFRDELTDLISFYRFNPCALPGITPPGVICSGASSYAAHNTGTAVVKGAEAQIQWRLDKDTRLIYGYSRTLISSLNEDGVAYTNAAPSNSQSLLISHRLNDRWSGSLTGHQVAETHMIGADSGPGNRNYFVDSYRRWDGRVAYAFRSGTASGELAMMVQNLTNARYFEYRHDNEQPGRTAWLNLKLDL